MKHGIIIPCYNEEERIDRAAFVAYANAHEDNIICLVNDGSKDNTLEVLRDIAAKSRFGNIRVYDMVENEGKAGAVRRGAIDLYRETDVQTVGFLDADLSTSFAEYMQLAKSIEQGKLKVVIGSRNMAEAKVKRDPVRKLLSDFIRLLIFFILRMRIADTQCGAKVFHRSVVLPIYYKKFFSRWLFDIEIFLRLKKYFGRARFMELFKEVPLGQWVHVEGSKLSLRDSIYVPVNLAKICNEYQVKPVLESVSDVLGFYMEEKKEQLVYFIDQPVRIIMREAVYSMLRSMSSSTLKSISQSIAPKA